MAWRVTANPERFDEALDWFSRRVVLTEAEAIALGVDASDRAFWIGGGLQLTQIERVFGELQKAIESGEPFEEWRERVRGELFNDAHAETVFRNAVQRAYQAGRYRQLTEPSVAQFRPYWLYDAVLDDRTTKGCKKRDGVLLPIDHPWWRTNYPPNHHRCRAGVRALRKSEAERRGITKDPPKTGTEATWGRLPQSQGVWKPTKKGKNTDADKLVDELEAKRAKPAPKTKERKPAQRVPELRKRAGELADALEQGDGAKARAMLRSHVAETFPGTQSRGVLRHLPNRDEIRIGETAGANATYDWRGHVKLSPDTSARARRGLRQLAAGELDDESAFQRSPFERLALQQTGADPVANADAIRTLFHEEIHGFSRMTGDVYRGPAAVIEEATTELAARKAFSELTPGLRRNRGDLQTGFQSYENYITRLEGILERRAGIPKGIKARQALVDARVKGLMGDGPDLTTGRDYLQAFVAALDVTDEQRREILLDISKLKATHLPEPFQ